MKVHDTGEKVLLFVMDNKRKMEDKGKDNEKVKLHSIDTHTYTRI